MSDADGNADPEVVRAAKAAGMEAVPGFFTPAEAFSLLAAGPLEDLLSEHGPVFIDRLEQEATASKRFDHLLGGVWRLSMTDDVWNRVQKARSAVW